MKYSGIGGQAVMEGVMMRNGDKYAVSVRKESGEMVTENFTTKKRPAWVNKTPILRGILSFWDSLYLGMKTLSFSASFFEDESEKPMTEKQQAAMLTGTMILSIVLAVAIFFCIPYFASMLIKKYIASYALTALLEGVIRISLFLLYLWAISHMEDIHRVFMYHGAEHKCINCVENGMELTVENVRKSSREHKRCGTSFMFFVLLISIFLFMFIRVDSRLMQLGLRLLLIPIIAGISYEFIRLAGRKDNIFVRIISKPGMWIQSITTAEPDDSMIEVGIASTKAVFDVDDFLKNYHENTEDCNKGCN